MSFAKPQPGKKLIDVSADQKRTRIIISFAMANHGANFAHWLRNKLMLEYKLAGTTTVYLDSVTCRDAGAEIPKLYFKRNPNYDKNRDKPDQQFIPNYEGPPKVPKTVAEAKSMGSPTYIDKADGQEKVLYTSVMPDMREDRQTADGGRAIGAMLGTWNKLFKAAMAEADVMVFCYTEEWRESKNCMKEWGQFQKLNSKRAAEQKPPLRAIVLDFTSRDKPAIISGPNVTRLEVDKQPQFIADRDDYVIRADDLTNLFRMIGPLS